MTIECINVASSQDGGQPKAQQPGPLDQSWSVTGKVRFLIVEDDYLIGALCEEWLGGAGYNIIGIVTTVDDALTAAIAHHPELVIMDIRLAKGGDGVEAALEVFRATGVRSLFASAHFDESTKKRAVNAQPLGWIAKPYTESTLLNAVDDALTRQRNEKPN